MNWVGLHLLKCIRIIDQTSAIEVLSDKRLDGRIKKDGIIREIDQLPFHENSEIRSSPGLKHTLVPSVFLRTSINSVPTMDDGFSSDFFSCGSLCKPV